MADLVVGCLVYLNDSVYDRRIDMCRESFTSFRTFGNQKKLIDLIFVNNGDDPRVEKELRENVPLDYKLLNLKKNFFDISVHMCSYWRALETGAKYFAYTYDDFVFYDDFWVKHTLDFMDEYNNISCIRLPRYMAGDPFHNANVTSKDENPDAVRHEDGAGGYMLQMINVDAENARKSPYQFYASNWRPNSRPTLWRTERFGEMIEHFKIKLPVMQVFEMLMYSWADYNVKNWCSGFINRGVCYTFPTQTSERTQSPNHYRDITIDAGELRAAYEAAR